MELKDAIAMAIRVVRSSNAKLTALDIACLIDHLMEEFENTIFFYKIENIDGHTEGKLYFENDYLDFSGSVTLI